MADITREKREEAAQVLEERKKELELVLSDMRDAGCDSTHYQTEANAMITALDTAIAALREPPPQPTIPGLTPYQTQLALDGAESVCKELAIYHDHGIWKDNVHNFINITLLFENMEKFFQRMASSND